MSAAMHELYVCAIVYKSKYFVDVGISKIISPSHRHWVIYR